MLLLEVPASWFGECVEERAEAIAVFRILRRDKNSVEGATEHELATSHKVFNLIMQNLHSTLLTLTHTQDAHVLRDQN